MLTILFRKMKNTRWMVLCLFVGFLMAAGMMSTVPIYMDASLQRMLTKDMEQYQLDNGTYPGQYIVSSEFPAGITAESQLSIAEKLPVFVGDEVSAVGIPVDTCKTVYTDNLLYLMKSTGSGGSTRVKVASMTDFENHITIIQGRMYVDGGVADDGTIEVVVDETAVRTLGIVFDNTYEVQSIESGAESVMIHIVGVFQQSDVNDTYWSETMTPYLNSVFVPTECHLNKLIPGGTIGISAISVNYNLDYHSVDMNRISEITAAINEDFTTYKNLGYEFEMKVSSILEKYVSRAADLTTILWVIQIPTMVMLAFYLFMVSQLNVEQEKNEISVLKSRGASPKQIFMLYAMESGILGLITLVVAPFIGLLLCQFLGVSNGFLEFVNRTGISARITFTAVIYALIAVAVFFVTTMIPIIPASKLTIVQYKQSRTKVAKTAIWEKFGLDFILIAASIGLGMLMVWNYNQSIINGTASGSGKIEPMLFVMSTCFIMGMGLLFIRLYPHLVRLVYLIGKPFWTPSQYMAITSVSCSSGSKERFLMMFLVITFSFGLFSANTARAINNNIEDRIYYQNGADVTLTEYWVESSYTVNGETVTTYEEKDFSRIESLAGVASATKVIKNDKAKAALGSRELSEVTVMAIEPDKFAQTAWFRDDLLPVHCYNYCNALTNYATGALISRSIADEYEVELGDEISLKWGGNDYVNSTVIAIVDYWPGINIYKTDGSMRFFAVLNYNYVYNATDVEPYSAWIKLEDGASSEALYADISEKRIPVESLVDSTQLLISEKTEPQLQGMNGGLTLGFIIIMLMTVIGFLIYWILSIKRRTLQFGILRAMGVTFREIIGILGYEQLLVSGASIAIAFVIGGMASDLFVPMFQYFMYDVVDQVPPFSVSAMQSDYIKIYTLIVIIFGGGFAILGSIIKKININKALKLGED